MDDLQVRPALPADVPGIASVHASAFAEPWAVDFWAAQLCEHTSKLLVGGFGTDVAGFVLARRVVDEAEIISIATHPSERRRGLADALLEHLEADLRRNGPCRLFLEVSVENKPAVCLYRSRGFEQVGYRKAYYKPPGRAPVDALVLARRFGA